MLLNILKYTIFVVLTLTLLILWNAVFILQGGIGVQGSFLLVPIKVIPIFLFSSLASWFILKMFVNKGKILKRKKASYSIGVISVVLSLIFQYSILSKKVPPFVLQNKMFSHLDALDVNDEFYN
ncbi:hypothetical protein A9Q84_07980 [Halobacteriovorax marinus]|uniref:Uncharacterized protein n=1 Tax=Halobacteriovorax marinus TaxID=97084 RepID=A0A1Y5F5X9_9BACT|nr:hypothetical protein A9Q84_07980 [Halobacteriovorax marinus]